MIHAVIGIASGAMDVLIAFFMQAWSFLCVHVLVPLVLLVLCLLGFGPGASVQGPEEATPDAAISTPFTSPAATATPTLRAIVPAASLLDSLTGQISIPTGVRR